jgi:hydrogenase maturation factor
VPVASISLRVCQVFGLDPMAAIASGALLLTAPPTDALEIRQALEREGITCAEIGEVLAGPVEVWQETKTGRKPLPRPQRDELARVYDL